LKEEIQRLGGFVISVPNDVERIRFQFLTPCSIELHKLRDLGFEPTFRNAGLRFHHDTALPCHTYELVLPVERQVVIDDRTIKDTELAEPKTSNAEREKLLQKYGLRK